MKKVYLLLCVVALGLVCACDRATPLTQQQIEQFLKELDAAATRKDPSVLLDHLAKDAVITVKSISPYGGQNATYTAPEYRKLAQDQMAALIDYRYQRLETKIDLAPDKKTATITLKVRENLVMRQGAYTVESQQVSTCVGRGGKLLLTRIAAESRLVRTH